MGVHKMSYNKKSKRILYQKLPIPYTMNSFSIYGYVKRTAMISKIEFNMKKSKITSRNIDMQNF